MSTIDYSQLIGKICLRSKDLIIEHMGFCVPHPDDMSVVIAEKTTVSMEDGSTRSTTRYITPEEFFGSDPRNIHFYVPKDGYIYPSTGYKYKCRPLAEAIHRTYELVSLNTPYCLLNNNCGTFAFDCACEDGNEASALVGQSIATFVGLVALAVLIKNVCK